MKKSAVEFRAYPSDTCFEGVTKNQVFIKYIDSDDFQNGGIIVGNGKSYYFEPMPESNWHEFDKYIYPVINFLQQRDGVRYRIVQVCSESYSSRVKGVVLETDE